MDHDGEPILLVSYNHESHRFQLNPQAKDILASLPRPLGVLCVTGIYRTGKSFLLNRILLNQRQGFAVGSTINATTKGIWMWSKPVLATTASGQEIKVISTIL